MPMHYDFVAIPDSAVPHAASPIFQHLLETYASKVNKVISVWRESAPAEMSFRPHPRSSTVLEILRYQLLSERRFFWRVPGRARATGSEVLPHRDTPEG